MCLGTRSGLDDRRCGHLIIFGLTNPVYRYVQTRGSNGISSESCRPGPVDTECRSQWVKETATIENSDVLITLKKIKYSYTFVA
jgi:hypothetical protein